MAAFWRAYDSSRDGLSDGQPNSTMALLPTTLVTAPPTAIHHVASLFELRLTIAACFLETNYVQALLLQPPPALLLPPPPVVLLPPSFSALPLPQPPALLLPPPSLLLRAIW